MRRPSLPGRFHGSFGLLAMQARFLGLVSEARGTEWVVFAKAPFLTLKMKPGPARAHFTRLAWAKGNSKATVAAARKLSCYLFWMLKEERTYPDWLQNRHSNQLLEMRPT